MKNRRRQGATLGLVAVCVLVIIVIGIGCFFLAKIFGGGREVANATDAGALNIAKSAMKNKDDRVGVDATLFPSFLDCADPPGSIDPQSKITLLTYNRCVAQALLVALNAQAETAAGATSANANAGLVLAELNNLGSALAGKLEDPSAGGPVSYFADVKNDTRMWGNNGVNQTKYVWAFMKPQESTNIYFTSTELPRPLPANWKSKGTDKVPQPLAPLAAVGNAYMAGYEPMSVPAVGTIIGVPVFPQQNPHLVSLADFSVANTAPAASVPPNSFSVQSNSKDSKSGNFGGAVAAAIVGAVKQTAAGGGAAPVKTFEYAAALPGGYIELSNLPGNTLPPGYGGFDNAGNIFNNELYYGPGIDIAPTASGAAFSNTDMGATQAWANFNNSSPGNPNGDGSGGTFVNDGTNHNRNIYPPNIGHPLSVMKVTNSTTAAGTTPAGDTDLRTITSPGTNCLTQLQGPGVLSGTCLNFLNSMENTYSPGPSGGGSNPLDSQPIYSNVDMVKGAVIKAFQNGQQSYDVNGSATPSGLGVYPNVNGPNPTPKFDAPIQRKGTVMQLLTQVTSGPNASCTLNQILAQIRERCYEIKPDAKAADIDNLLTNQELPMGSDLYICLPNGDESQNLTIVATPPKTFVPGPSGKGPTPDGAPAGSFSMPCADNYQLTPNFVDVRDTGSLPADDNLHEMPYENASGNVAGQDHADWVLSSGYQNLLGKLQFSNTTSGSEHFSRPN